MTKNQQATRTMFGGIARVATGLLLVGGAFSFMTLGTHAALDAYLRIPGIDGSSKDAAHVKWIAASSVVAGDLNGDAQADREASELTARKAGGTQEKANIGSQSSGAGAGKLTATSAPRDVATGQASGKRMHKPFTITKEVDQASPKLFEMCASGKHIAEVDVDMGSAHYVLEDVVISSATKSSGARPMETLSFTYQKIEMK